MESTKVYWQEWARGLAIPFEWQEAVILAARLGLDSVTVIIDANDLQGYDRVSEIQPHGSHAARFESFGWAATEVDGHDLQALSDLFKSVPIHQGKPSVIVANTVLGKGVSEMEDKLGWHYFNVSDDQLDPFLNELEGDDS